MKLSHLSPRATGLAATLAAAVALTLSGCASTPVSVEQIAVADAAVQHASTPNTSEDAAGQLQVATSKLASARQAAAAKDYDLARQLADQTVVDAQVAEAHAQAVRSRRAAQESQEAARALTEEINRKTVVR